MASLTENHNAGLHNGAPFPRCGICAAAKAEHELMTSRRPNSKPAAWLTRAITHLALPADKAMDNDSLHAISLLLAKLKEASR